MKKTIQIKKIFSNFIWLFLALLAISLRWLASSNPEIVESVYSNGFFVFIRVILGLISPISPIPLMYVFIGVLLFFLIKKIILLFRKGERWSVKLLSFGRFVINLIAGLVFFFLVFWGYNYQRVPIETKLGFVPKPLSLTELKEELDLLTPQLIEQRLAFPNQGKIALDESFYPADFEEEMNEVVRTFLMRNGYRYYYQPNARLLQPKGILLRNSTAGIYFPWVGEANIDAGLHALSKPYVLAHEFGHAYGWGDEGTCNFIAYLACSEAQNPFIQYCGLLGYWRTLASNYKSYQPEKYADFRSKLPKGIVADLNAINETHNQYPDLFPKFRDATYDAFLKAQGIDEGMENYNRVIMLGRAWRLANNPH